MKRRRQHQVSSRGLTLLEVVLAVVMLSMVATSVMSAIGFVLGSEGRSRKILAANEIANRLILTHLSDDKKMPPRNSPIDYGPYRFSYDYDLSNVTMELSTKSLDNQARSNPTSSGSPNASRSRFKLLTVTVYEGLDRSAGGVERGEQLATLSRIFDPTAVRNPDVLNDFNNDPDRLKVLIDSVTGNATGGSGSSSGTRGLGRSRESLEKTTRPNRSSRD